jgi:hypothetical protein
VQYAVRREWEGAVWCGGLVECVPISSGMILVIPEENK